MNRATALLLVTGCLVASTVFAQEDPGPATQPVVIVNNTRFEPVAQDVVIPPGESARFEVRSNNFARVSLLVGGTTTPGAAAPRLVTLYGPPFVPSALPRKLAVDNQGAIRGQVLEPVLGPALVIVLQNPSASPMKISLSAYLSN